MACRARSTNLSMGMSSLATPKIGQSSNLRFSRRYSARNVILRAKSPVIPKITSRSDESPPSSAKSEPPKSYLIGSLGVRYPGRSHSTLDTAGRPDNRKRSEPLEGWVR